MLPATTLGIVNFHPKAIINQRTAGAHNPKLQLWDSVVEKKTTRLRAHSSLAMAMPVRGWIPRAGNQLFTSCVWNNQNLSEFPAFR